MNKKYNFLTINRSIPPSNLVCSTNAFACTRIVITDKIVKLKMIKLHKLEDFVVVANGII